MPTNRCPTREQIREYVFGKLPDEAADTVAAHIDTCADCERILEELEQLPDEVLADLRAANPLDPYVSEPECQQAREQILAASAGSANSSAASAAEPDAQGIAGQVLGNCQLLEEIGQGGMGTVYKARHPRLGKLVAVKVLRADRVKDPDAVARFEREMKAVGQLEHPNIVRAMDASESDGRHFLVMEYVPGLNLEAVVKSCGPLPIPEACELVRQTALGLQCAHEHDLVHRDIKPSNLMLTPAGQVKILDLGLAKLRTPPVPGREMTATGQTMGTADYIAPEQAANSHDVDIRADIYSLGCTLYKLLTGHVPFDAPKFANASEKMRAHIGEPFPQIKASRPDLPAGVVSTLERMVAKNPDDRFATPSEVATVLAPFAIGSDLRAVASGKLQRQPREGRIAWPKVLAVAAILLVAVGWR